MPAPTTYTSSELCAKRGDLTIYGQLYLPTGDRAKGPLPTVAAAHGFGANYLHNVPYAWALAEHGVAVYCFDFCGGGYASRSDGNPIDMSIETEKEDLLAVMDMLRTQDVVDADNLFLMGEGQGGLVATMAACERAEEVRGLILLYPAFQLHDEARRLFPTTKNIPVSYRQLGMRVGRGYGLAAWNDNPYTYMRDYPGDVLILHGDEDATSLIEYSERAEEVFPSARLETIRGGKHVFRDKALAKSCVLIEDFVDAEVAKGQSAAAAAEDVAHAEEAGTADGTEAAGVKATIAEEATSATRPPARHAAPTRPRYNPDYVAQTVRGRHFKRTRRG